MAALPASCLCFVDEQFDVSGQQEHCLFMSNRFDTVRQLRSKGAEAVFSDFDIKDYPANSYDTIQYRISKEKALVHHLINSAWRLLEPGGELLLSGAKNAGIKTYLTKAGMLFNSRPDIRKEGSIYRGRIVKSSATPGVWLDDQDYSKLRFIGKQDGIEFLSKPGVFGWNKIDQGSALLVEQLPELLAKTQPQSLLDLGCGYGYLALLAQRLHHFERILTIDNNAAALLACRANFEAQGISQAEVIADDCAAGIHESFDLILCNPPFHRGFEHDKQLTGKFLAAAARLLKSKGQTLFVVNRFIALERLARDYFRHVSVIAENRSYQVIELSATRLLISKSRQRSTKRRG